MTSIFVFARRLAYLTLGWFDLITHRRLPIVILCYHSLSSDDWLHSVSLSNFHSQINYLSTSNYHFVTLKQIANYLLKAAPLPLPAAAITFDDGYQDIVSAASLLEKYKIHPTVFVLSDPARADRKQLANSKKFIPVSDLKSLSRLGWEIGCHTATHPDLTALNNSRLASEINSSKHHLSHLLSFPINYLAYPKGKYSPPVLAEVKKAGYLLGLSLVESAITPVSHPLHLARIAINHTHSSSEFKALLTPSVNAIRYLVQKAALKLNTI